MPRGPKGERRLADGNAVQVMRIATGEIEDAKATPRTEGRQEGRLGRQSPIDAIPSAWLRRKGLPVKRPTSPRHHVFRDRLQQLTMAPGRCPCRKLTLGYIGGAARPRWARPTSDRRSGRRAGSARPSAVISGCGPRCNIFDTI
jgi:hypothetical protein